MTRNVPEFTHVHNTLDHEENVRRVMNAHLLTVFAQICVTIGTSIPCSIDVVHATITQCCGMSDTREVICFVDQFEEHGPVVEGKFFVPL